MPFRRIALLLAAASGLHGLVYVPLVSTNIETDTWSYVASANAIRDGSYTTPLQAGFVYVFPTGWFDITGVRVPQRVWQEPERQTFRPPGYPAYLALFGKKHVFEDEHSAALVGQGVLFGLGALLLMLCVRDWWGERAALLTGLAFALDPWSKHYVALVLSEALTGFVALACLYAFTRAWRSGSLAWWAATGAAAGALTLVRAVFVVAVPLVLLAAVLRSATWRRRLGRAAAAAALAAAFVVPWLAWTNSVVRAPVLASWGEGYNLLLAAHGEGYGRSAAEVERTAGFRADLRQAHRLAPSPAQLASDALAHPRYLRAADVELRSAANDAYRDRLGDEPLRVAWDALYRAFFLWNAHEDWYQPDGALLWVFRVFDAALLLLALGGAALAIARGGPGRAVVLALGAYTLVLCTHHVEARFAMPLRGPFLALAALALLDVSRRARGQREQRAEPERDHRRAPD